MNINYSNLSKISEEVNKTDNCKLLIVTKNQSIENIQSLINNGYQYFGENKVQEAKIKFSEHINDKNINLHLIGPLQTNKVKVALKLFDSIQSVDRITLVDEISKKLSNNTLNKTREFYIQVNIGNEEQKSGVKKKDTKKLYDYCLSKNINIVGLMCIPPNDDKAEIYFKEMVELKKFINPNFKLSMGMSSDYKIAINHGSNMVRVGSLIFN